MQCLNCFSVIKTGKYCSRQCYFKYKYESTHPSLECDYCGTMFFKKLNRIKEKNYCSKKCSGPVNRSKYTITDEHKLKIQKIAIEKGYGKWAKGRPGNSGSFKKGQHSGNKHPNWKGGITPINTQFRASDIYKEWRDSVFKRDNWRCQWCGIKGGKLNADHIKAFSIHKRDRLKLKNGRTLCEKCHKKRTALQLTIIWKNQFSN